MAACRDFAAELQAARAAQDWGAHQRIWEERRNADVAADEASLARTDTSTVFHVSLLDADIAAAHDPATPWIFEYDNGTDGGQIEFATEDEARKMQRDYRRARGFDPISGERLFQRC